MSIRVGIRHLGRPIRVVGPWAGAEKTEIYNTMDPEAPMLNRRFQCADPEAPMWNKRFHTNDPEAPMYNKRFMVVNAEITGV